MVLISVFFMIALGCVIAISSPQLSAEVLAFLIRARVKRGFREFCSLSTECEEEKKEPNDKPFRQNARGRDLEKKERSVGRQAHITPKFTSISPQIEAPRSPVILKNSRH